MKRIDVEERIAQEARFMINNNATIRATAKEFGVSKSTTHKDLTKRLKDINPALCAEVKKVLEQNKEERHIRGGMVTRETYRKRRMKEN